MVLRDMRYVYKHPGRKMTSESRRQMLELYRKDFWAFLDRLQEFEDKCLKAQNERLVTQSRAGKRDGPAAASITASRPNSAGNNRPRPPRRKSGKRTTSRRGRQARAWQAPGYG